MSSAAPSLSAPKEDVTVRLLTAFKWLISEGTLSTGARLPAERDLAEKFQVSRSSLRQALKVLEIMGVISQRVGDGTYVTSGDSSVLAESLEFLILLNGISFHEVMEARIIVEPELAARAATRATAKDHAALRHEMKAMKASGKSTDSLSKHDLEFHKIIFDAAGSRVCSMLFTVIHQSLHKLIEMTSRLVSVEHTMIFHQRIYSAIVQGDPAEARKRMSEHLLDVQNLLSRANLEKQSSQVQSRISQLAIQSPRPRTRKR
ncbi:MAG TPA: FCD domain-containing protein [Candidatus Acidoferrum sp.]|jgi:GntR family transcriptional repressor for pyruvate dehydrogenase complex|nr:FCD domain-containing protein [Candidatus Acidoferrum sp.]